jgi:hypothetical protein
VSRSLLVTCSLTLSSLRSTFNKKLGWLLSVSPPYELSIIDSLVFFFDLLNTRLSSGNIYVILSFLIGCN